MVITAPEDVLVPNGAQPSYIRWQISKQPGAIHTTLTKNASSQTASGTDFLNPIYHMIYGWLSTGDICYL